MWFKTKLRVNGCKQTRVYVVVNKGGCLRLLTIRVGGIRSCSQRTVGLCCCKQRCFLFVVVNNGWCIWLLTKVV